MGIESLTIISKATAQFCVLPGLYKSAQICEKLLSKHRIIELVTSPQWTRVWSERGEEKFFQLGPSIFSCIIHSS